MKGTTSFKHIIVLIALFVLAACSGGGDDGNRGDGRSGSSNWGVMVWDQDNWAQE